MSNTPTDENIPRIVLDKEDRDAYRRNRTPDKKGKDPSKPLFEEDSAATSKSSGLTYFLMILVLGLGVSSGFLFYQLDLQTKQLTSAVLRINELEQKLSATGEEMGESTVAMQVKVKELAARADELWNQMDKLWASAWRRNQQEIKALATNVENEAKNTTRTTSTLKSSIEANGTKLRTIDQSLAQHAAELSQLGVALSSLDQSNADKDIELTALNEKLIMIEQRNNGLIRRLSDIEKRQTNAAVSSAAPEVTTPQTQPPAPPAQTTDPNR